MNDKPTQEPQRKDRFEIFREEPVGTNDPNIVGDVGPFDVPPGSDPREENDLTVVIDLDHPEESFDYE